MGGTDEAARLRRLRLAREQVASLYHALRVDVVASPVWAVFAVVCTSGIVFGTPVPLRIGAAWVAYVLVTGPLVLLLVHLIHRGTIPPESRWRTPLLVLVGIDIGIMWPILAHASATDDPANHMGMLVVVLVFGTILVLRYAGHPLVVRTAVVTTFVPLGGGLVLAEDSSGFGLGMAVIAFGIWTMIGLEMMIGIHRGSRALRHESEELAREMGPARDRAEEERASAERANEARSEFLAQMSHELRTPLNAILGFSDLLTSGLAGPLEPDRAAYARNIHEAGTHLLSLVSEILDLSRIETGVADLEPETLNLDDSIESAIRIVAPRARAAGIAIARDPQHSGIVLDADRLRLKQILVNLLSNAIKFSHPGGAVAVRAAVAGGNARVVVEDEGIGMAPEDVPRALEPFRRIEAGAALAEGTGLGLPLTARLVALHGGTLRIESAPGRGTRVAFTLPGAREEGGAP